MNTPNCPNILMEGLKEMEWMEVFEQEKIYL